MVRNEGTNQGELDLHQKGWQGEMPAGSIPPYLGDDEGPGVCLRPLRKECVWPC